MTNTEIIQAIRAEIERNRQGIRVLNEHTAPEQMSKTCAIFQYSDTILSALLSFLSTLESEKPMQEGLDEELTNEADRIFYSYEIHEGYYLEPTIDCVSLEQFRGIARHFVEWGAERQKEQDEKEQADLFTIVALDAAQRAKNKMMEDAKEGKIIFLLNGDVAVNIGDTDEYKLGQKVRIIICKKEDEK